MLSTLWRALRRLDSRSCPARASVYVYENDVYENDVYADDVYENDVRENPV
jgi:hypothetical protein